LLNRLGLLGVAPAPDEDVFVKRYMDAFTDIDDVLARPELRKYVDGQRTDNRDFHDKIIDGSINKEDYFGRPTLLEHLKAQGVEHITMAGTMAGFCIANTAINAAMHGFQVTIFSDLVVGWEDKTYRKAVWDPNSPEDRVKEITDRLDEIIRDPESAGFKESDRAALIEARKRIEIRTSSDFLESPRPKATAAPLPDPKPAPSK
jgi:nicotinamidase-related amidase